MAAERRPSAKLNLRMGDPDPQLLRLSYIERALEHPPAGLITKWGAGYAPDQGHPPLIECLAREASLECGRRVDASEVLITNGATQGLDFAAHHLSKNGDVVLAPVPIYSEALKLFRDRNLDVVPFSSDAEEGIVQAFEEAADACIGGGRRIAFAFLIPTFNNPDGRCLTLYERAALHAAASERKVWIVEDDTYRITGSGDAPAPLYALGNKMVINVSSFSKSVCPGLRMGRILALPEVIGTILETGYIGMGGGAGLINSVILEGILADLRWADYKKDVRLHYARKAGILRQALIEHAPSTVKWRDPDGGFFFWLRVQSNRSTNEIVHRAYEAGVLVMPGDLFSPGPSHDGIRHLRLSFSYEDEADLSPAIVRLCQSLA